MNCLRRFRFGRVLADSLRPQKPWQFRVDCVHPLGWFSSYSFYFDKRIRACLYMRVMRDKGWDVTVRGERWV